MITTLCYLFILLWDVPVEKEKFASCATLEFGIELFSLICFLPIIIIEMRDK